MKEQAGSLPNVSVIIPVYNDQDGLNACLDGLERQTYSKGLFEVVVVDNASEPAIQVHDGRSIKVVQVTCQTAGSYAARNAGIAVAGGDVLAFTDADCVPDRCWISGGVAALQDGKERRVIGGEVRMRTSDRPTAVELYQCLDGFDQLGSVETRGYTATANLFVFAAALRDIGPFDEGLLSGGDREWSWRAADSGYQLVFAGDAVVETMPRTSVRSAARQARRVAGGLKALRSHRALVPRRMTGVRRGALASVGRIIGHTEFGLWDRLRVLSVALLLYFVRISERVRLAIGGNPERR